MCPARTGPLVSGLHPKPAAKRPTAMDLVYGDVLVLTLTILVPIGTVIALYVRALNQR